MVLQTLLVWTASSLVRIFSVRFIKRRAAAEKHMDANCNKQPIQSDFVKLEASWGDVVETKTRLCDSPIVAPLKKVAKTQGQRAGGKSVSSKKASPIEMTIGVKLLMVAVCRKSQVNNENERVVLDVCFTATGNNDSLK